MSALSNIRNNLSSSGSSIIVGIIIFGLVATFGGFLGEGSAFSSNNILSVNGKSISSGEYSLEFGRISGQVSENDQDISDELIESFAKDSIILKELYSQSASKAGLNIDDKKLNAFIVNDPSFYNNNSFDVELFKGFLSRLGMTPDLFKEYIKSRYLALELQNLINKDINFSNDRVRNFIEANNQTRDISFARIILAEESLKEVISEQELNDYYEENKFLYISPLKITYKFLKINQESFKDSILISEDEILFEEDEFLKNFRSQKKVSHIEISYNEDNKEEQFNTINNLLNNLTNKNISFEDAVLEFSTDLSTKNIKGDLGYTDGTIFPEEFEQELKRIKLNQLSKVIDLTTSFHIIKFTEETNSNFSREDIIERITLSKASEKLDDALNFVEENIFVSDIELISNEFGLKINNVSMEEENIFLSKFEDLDLEEIEEGGLYGPLEVEDGFYVVDIDDIQEQGFKTINEVKKNIEKELKSIKASRKTNFLVETAIKELTKDSKKFTKYSDIKRDNFLLPLKVTNKLFSFETSIDDVFSLILDNGDAYILKLEKINENDGVISSEDLDEGKKYLTSVYQEIIRQSFIGSLRKSATIN